MPNRKVAVVLPALDEQKTIGKVIDSIPVELLVQSGYGVDITVVDGHSKDMTGAIAKARGARLLVQHGRGKGDAVRTAFEQFDGDYLFMLDADDTYPAEKIPDMLRLMENNVYDVMLGSRLAGSIEPGAMSRLNYIGNVVLTETANLLYENERPITDVCTGFWGFDRDAVEHLTSLSAKNFEVEAEIYAKCVKAGYRVGEIPIRYTRRVSPPKLSSIRDGTKIFWRLFRERL
jgi:glycosyltransferase involved in cell wall biosynthesis